MYHEIIVSPDFTEIRIVKILFFLNVTLYSI